ncbi:hypothetical protein [Ideonella sp.]|uniref:hypothetical protein n=1 Tax=Ideonella sp. TaxID=1929293 RepID=UPI003BB5A586
MSCIVLSAIQARRTERSAFAWAAIVFFTAPVGPLISCFSLSNGTNELLFRREKVKRILQEGL